ncbi:MAG TPA: hypothetical protein DCQ06_02620 [Myxococcales bacterium]|nr:hypothetical protein [Myxococcales bacterium]HAN30468.1 hypothetical protein [Myxococcales bacterium]
MRIKTQLTAALWCLIVSSIACQEPSTVVSPIVKASPPETRARSQRVHAAAITVRFSNSGVEPGSQRLGYDRLRVSAVFADADRNDVHLLAELIGPPLQVLPGQGLDRCVRSEGPWVGQGALSTPSPRAYLQLLDVGNLSLQAGKKRLPLQISMVPSLFSAVRGVRYDGDVDYGRSWLAHGSLKLVGTGGDNIAPFDVKMPVPRPVRITHVGGLPSRRGLITGLQDDREMTLRWGSVDGQAELQIWIGAEQGRGSDWIRCRLRDDGSFVVAPTLLQNLPRRSPRQPWLVVMVRSTQTAMPGFSGTPLRLELIDSVRVM